MRDFEILEHLGQWVEKTPDERAPPVTIPEKRNELVVDGWLQYEESFITVH